MRLFIICGLLAISCVHAHPTLQALQAYSPARGEFSVQHNALPLLRTADRFASGYELSDISKVEEDRFRAWCAQRYESLRTELDQLRLEGKKPSPAIVAELAPLKTIMSSSISSYAGIGETAEVKRAREEHLRIWNEARLKVLQAEAEHLRLQSNELTTYKSEAPLSYQGLAAIEETAEQKKAREEHLRFYNDQLLLVQKLEAQQIRDGGQRTDSIVVKTAETPVASRPIELTPQGVMETPEVIRAKEEHLRLWNEAKLRAEKDGYREPAAPIETISQSLISSVKTGSLSGFKEQQSYQQQLHPQQPAAVEDTPEVMRARAEHLRLVEEARLRAQAAGTAYKPNADLPEPVLLKVTPGIQQPLVLPQQPAAIVKTTSNDLTANLESQTAEGLNEEEAGRRTEQLRELERQREEENMRKVFQSIESERLAAEQRFMESETLRLRQEEERRRETERLAEAKRQSLPELDQSFLAQGQQITKSTIDTTIPVVGFSQFALTDKRKQNPFFSRLGAQSGIQTAAQTGSYISSNSISSNSISSNSAEGIDASKYFLPAGSSAHVINLDSPLVIRYNNEGRPEFYIQPNRAQVGADVFPATELKPIAAPELFPSYPAGSSATMKISYGEGAGLSELERATREHFRAHEIALEQLRLANLKNPYHKDC